MTHQDSTTAEPPAPAAAPPETAAPAAATEADLASLRGMALGVYGLYMASMILVFTVIVGVIIAYVKRDDAAGTIYESHFRNQITVFWFGILAGLVGGVLTVVGIGWLILLGAGIWWLYRTIKGLIRALERKPYA